MWNNRWNRRESRSRVYTRKYKYIMDLTTNSTIRFRISDGCGVKLIRYIIISTCVVYRAIKNLCYENFTGNHRIVFATWHSDRYVYRIYCYCVWFHNENIITWWWWRIYRTLVFASHRQRLFSRILLLYYFNILFTSNVLLMLL